MGRTHVENPTYYLPLANHRPESIRFLQSYATPMPTLNLRTGMLGERDWLVIKKVIKSFTQQASAVRNFIQIYLFLL
jgi:hypothetical protein